MAIPGHDWYLHDWCKTLGVVQNDLVTKLGLHKNTANRLWHGKQPYRRDYVNDIAALLQIQPYELLMHPDEAMAFRSVRRDALRIVEATAISQSSPEQPAETPARRKAG